MKKGNITIGKKLIDTLCWQKMTHKYTGFDISDLYFYTNQSNPAVNIMWLKDSKM